MKQTLKLVRKSDDDAICRVHLDDPAAAAAAAGKINLDKISLFMPYVMPSVMEIMHLYKTIESLPVYY